MTETERTVASVNDLPNPKNQPSVRLYSHSTLFYWWPVWLTGYIMAALTYFKGGEVQLDQVRNEFFHPSSAVGLIYVMVLLMVVLSTNLKLRGIYSIVLGLIIALLAVGFAWLRLWDDVLRIIPQLSVHMNMGFYVVFSTLLFVAWLLVFFIFDRMTFWRIVPGQLTEERLIGGGEESYDVRGMLFQQKSDDFFRHKILGFGSGDLQLNIAGAKEATIEIPNVLGAARKVRAIQRLITVNPDQLS